MTQSMKVVIVLVFCFFVITIITPLSSTASEPLVVTAQEGTTELSFEKEIKLLEELLEDLRTIRNQIKELRDSFDVLRGELSDLEERINSVKEQIDELREQATN